MVPTNLIEGITSNQPLSVNNVLGSLNPLRKALTFAIIHKQTGFIEGHPVQPPLADLGIRIHISIVPIAVMLLGVILFMMLNNLNPKKNAEIKKQLEELKL